ncbi:MAG: MgtC/SapB family protein [Roseobacter sp.]
MTRVVQGIIGAIGFLGAGVITTQSGTGRLRDAAIWGTGTIGIACGLGYFVEAFSIAILFFAVLNIYEAVSRATHIAEG